MKQRFVLILHLFVVTLFSLNAHAEIRLPQLLTDNMVLQRDTPIHLWGWAAYGEAVTVTLGPATVKTLADSIGRWDVYLPQMAAGGPYDITLHASNTIVLHDVLVGDVWIASGQSNMEMPLGGWTNGPQVKDAAAHLAAANYPEIRLFHVRPKLSAYPLDDLDRERPWEKCTPQTVADFTAVAYFFARDIYQAKHIPLGIIDSTWGGIPAEPFISLPALTSDSSFMYLFSEYAALIENHSEDLLQIAKEQDEDAQAKAAGLPLPKHPGHIDIDRWAPAHLYNAMIAPLTAIPIRGVIWYQGESSSDPQRSAGYAHLMTALIHDWRSAWHQGDFPFLFVQIANVKTTSLLPVVREAQRLTLAVNNTAMAVTIDVGDPDKTHYANKEPVGVRLALAARALAYGDHVEYSGPLYQNAAPFGSQIRVLFSHAAGLFAKGGVVKGFEVAGSDLHFYPASARIDGDQVVAFSESVPEPRYVRYAFANSPETSLYNKANLPASPFSSEPFGITMQPELPYRK